MRYLLSICVLVLLVGCTHSGGEIAVSSPGLIGARIAINDIVTFKKDFHVDIVIENYTDESIHIDTSPNEVIEPPTENSGGVYRERGSRCTITVTQDQDEDGMFDFFCTYDMKVLSPRESMVSFPIVSGRKHMLRFPISPWGLNYGSLPSTAIPGPAEIRAELRLVVDGQTLIVPLEPARVNFVQK